MTQPIRVGIVGTGYAAKLRVETFQDDRRAKVVAVAGQDEARTTAFCQPYGISPLATWGELVHHPDLDLVVICTVNHLHGAIARMALQAGKHVVVEYPLSLDIAEAEELVTLAKTQGRLLHIEQIDQLSGVHSAIAHHLSQIGQPLYVRYSSLNPQRPAPRKWTYQAERFGFPLVGALSRVHRLTALFGTVAQVSGQVQYWSNASATYPHTMGESFYHTCLCAGQLQFTSGLRAEVIYGKGESIWTAERRLDIHGEWGMIRFDGTEGQLITAEGDRPLDGGGRRGLFAQDTQSVLNHLTDGTPLYVEAQSSLYALRVAIAIRQAAEQQQVVPLR
jgi:biliverdin reductase